MMLAAGILKSKHNTQNVRVDSVMDQIY